MSMRLLLVPLVMLALSGGAAADELHLQDGEIVIGRILGEEKGRLTIEVGGTPRRIAVKDVASRTEGPDPWTAIEEAAARSTDGAALVQLALDAWHARLDAHAVRLAKRALLDEALPPARRQEAEALLQARAMPPRWGAPRRKALSAGGGNAASERRVQLALRWLADHQDEDGKLDADGFPRHDPADDKTDGIGGGHHGGRVPCPYDGVTTAVALMAWLADGSTPVSGTWHDHVTRALRYCVRVVEAGPGNAYGMWNYGYCVQAVGDAYLVSRDARLRPVLVKGVEGILRLQREDGGWSYYMRIGDVPTTAVAACGLAAARRAGIPVPQRRVDRTLAFLDARVHPHDGRSEYHDGAERKGYTPTRANAAAALTVRAAFGATDHIPHRAKQVASIGVRKPVWKLSYKDVKTPDGRTVRAQIGNLYPYLWSYTTTALFAEGGAAWSKWFGGLKNALAKGQRKDGAAKGSWDPLGTYSNSAGRVFITGLCALMLQTPYR